MLCAWRFSLTCGFLLAMLQAQPVEAGDDFDSLTIRIRVYDYVRIPEIELLEATRVAGEVLQKANIQVRWQECTGSPDEGRRLFDCDPQVRHTDVIVSLVPRIEDHFPGVAPNALGFSITPRGSEPATMAYVGYFRVYRLSLSCAFTVPELLGLATAHEIGHVLLADNSHSLSGIMRARWPSRDLQRRSWEQFQFTQDQIRKLRAAVRMRQSSRDHR
jgi:hypothetical protein